METELEFIRKAIRSWSNEELNQAVFAAAATLQQAAQNGDHKKAGAALQRGALYEEEAARRGFPMPDTSDLAGVA